VDRTHTDGETALHFAARFNKLEVAQLLLQVAIVAVADRVSNLVGLLLFLICPGNP
jgi:ankyrin repeat protein